MAVGIASYTAPLYLSEMASENVRGKMISMYQLMVTLGIVLAFLSDTAFSYSGNWRAMLGVLALPAVILIILVVFLPNSPRWLAEKGRHIEAEEVLRMLRDTSEKARDELNEIRESLKLKQGGWALFKVNRNVRRAVFLGMLLQAMQQFTGMNIIMYYAPRIFKMAGFTTTEQQMIATLVVGLTFMFATFIAVFTVDKAGRKPALKIGFSVMALGTLVLGYCLMQFDNGTASSGLSWLSVGMTMMCIAGYAMSAAPVVWILCSEIQPLKCRDFGITCSTTTNWVSNMIIGATFLTLLDAIGAAGTFWLYTALNVAFIGITFWLIPETKKRDARAHRAQADGRARSCVTSATRSHVRRAAATGWRTLARLPTAVAVNDMQGAQAAHVIMRQLHRGERRQEQIANAHHVVVSHHRHVLSGMRKPWRQQRLVDHKRDAIVAADSRSQSRGLPSIG